MDLRHVGAIVNTAGDYFLYHALRVDFPTLHRRLARIDWALIIIGLGIGGVGGRHRWGALVETLGWHDGRGMIYNGPI